MSAHCSIIPFPALPLEPDPEQIEAVSAAVTTMIDAQRKYLHAVVETVAQHTNGIDKTELHASIDAYLTDMCSDIVGSFDLAAERITEERYSGITTRGPMHFRRHP